MDWFLSTMKGLYGLGETLTYASQRLLTRQHWRENSLGTEFRRAISKRISPFSEDLKRLQVGGFTDWRLSIDGMVHLHHSRLLT